jgi:hypothetical protein
MAIQFGSVIVRATVIAVAATEVFVAAAPASADATLIVELLKYVTPEFGVRLARLARGPIRMPSR